jgi:hypothetical protein
LPPSGISTSAAAPGAGRGRGVGRGTEQTAGKVELVEQRQEDEAAFQFGAGAATEDKVWRRRLAAALAQPYLAHGPGEGPIRAVRRRQPVGLQRPGDVAEEEAEIEVLAIEQREVGALDLVQFGFVEAKLCRVLQHRRCSLLNAAGRRSGLRPRCRLTCPRAVRHVVRSDARPSVSRACSRASSVGRFWRLVAAVGPAGP